MEDGANVHRTLYCIFMLIHTHLEREREREREKFFLKFFLCIGCSGNDTLNSGYCTKQMIQSVCKWRALYKLPHKNRAITVYISSEQKNRSLDQNVNKSHKSCLSTSDENLSNKNDIYLFIPNGQFKMNSDCYHASSASISCEG